MEVLRTADRVAEAHQGWNGGRSIPSINSSSFNFSLSAYEGNNTDGEELLAPLVAWVSAQNQSINISGRINVKVSKRGSSWIGPAPEGQVINPHSTVSPVTYRTLGSTIAFTD